MMAQRHHLLLVRLVLIAVAWPGWALAQVCYDNLDRQTYSQGFQSTDFQTTHQTLINGGVQLTTGAQALDVNRIILPFDQEVRVRYVQRNTAASHTLGWSYLDQLQPNFVDASGNVIDADSDGIADFFQARSRNRPRDGLWRDSRSSSTPDLVDSRLNYSDGGNYPHIHNLLEEAVASGGGWIFPLCDDDTDTNVWNNWAHVADRSSTNDGIPDDDVNGDGIVGNEADRLANLGVIQGNREIVLFALTYFDAALTARSVGLPGNSTYSSFVTPFFTKSSLNPQSTTRGPNELLQRIAVGCARDDATCYLARGATLGWLEAPALARLNAAPYNFPQLGNTVLTVATDAQRNVPQFVAAAPQSAPNRWVVAFDDQPQYRTTTGGGTCSNCTSDADFNDVVFILERTNGGGVISRMVSSEIPAAELASTTISRVRIRRTVRLPSPCAGPPDNRVDIYFSVDGGVSWHLVEFPSWSPDDATIDLVQLGITGNQLLWRADLVTNMSGCQPLLTSLNIGYRALRSGDYQYSEPIPLANTLFRSSWEVVGPNQPIRGHLRMFQLYDPVTRADDQQQLWDAGAVLANQSASARTIYYNDNGQARTFSTATGSTLYARVLPPSVRRDRYSGRLVYDLNGDGQVDDGDAAVVVQYARGVEPGGAQRPWKLGAIPQSTPAVVGPVPRPWWLDRGATPPSERNAFIDFASQNIERQTVVIVGAQDGMLHGFRAGSFRYGDDPSTPTVETRGYYATVQNRRNYGDGAELWAFVPPAQLDKLKNSLPQVAPYRPELNPRPAVDGSITAGDVYYGGAMHTVALAAHGRTLPYLTALDVTNPLQPQPVWASDWTDSDFNGTSASPALAPTATPRGRRFVALTTSGLSTDLDDVFLFLIDVSDGTTLSKVQLNPSGARNLGSVGSPALVDFDEDGMVDRAYVADTSGRVYRVDTASSSVCQLANVGESIFAPLAVTLSSRTVHLYLGTADNPDAPDSAGPFRFHALDDTGGPGECQPARTVFSGTFGSGEKLWATPVVSGDSVYFATATGSLADACNTQGGNLYGYATTPDPAGTPIARFGPIRLDGGGAVGGIRAYDDHLIINTARSGTTLIGARSWNNAPPGSTGRPQRSSTTTSWYER